MKLKESLLFKKIAINDIVLLLLVVVIIVAFGLINSQFLQVSNLVQYLNCLLYTSRCV